MSVYYVAVDGDNKNTGSIDAPFSSLQYAHDLAKPGDTIYLRGGTYHLTEGIELTSDGVSGKPISVLAYPGEKPVLDASQMTQTGYWQGWAVDMNSCSYNHISGLEICNGPEGGLVMRGASNYNVIEKLNVHHNGHLSTWEGKGVAVYGSSAGNVLLNNDSHHNADITGANADGFQISTTGAGNVLRGNRAWNNSDDGFDLFNVVNNTSNPPVVIDGNWAWDNGYFPNGQPAGDGNGFKLGGARPGTNTVSGGHTVTNNIAWDNAANGFDENGASRGSALYNNTAHDNGAYNYFFKGTGSSLYNNLSSGTGKIEVNGTSVTNSWSVGAIVTSADFLSLDDSVATGPRAADGSLLHGSFLHLAPSSDLIDKGTKVGGGAHTGTAPDISGFESGSAPAPSTPPPTGSGTVPPPPTGSGTTVPPTSPTGVTIDGTMWNDVFSASSSAQGEPRPTAFADIIAAGGGADTIAGLAGADRLDGGTGADTATYAASNGGVNVSLATGKGGGGHAEGDILVSIENVVGSNYADVIEGDGGNNVLTGGGGVDTVSFAHAAAAVKVSLSTSAGQATGGAGWDRMSGFENLTGSAFGDTLTGNSGANVLDGGAGNDRLSGGRGNDRLDGGDGADILNGGRGNDVFVFDAFAPGSVDVIEDFNSAADQLQFSADAFGGGLVHGQSATLVKTAALASVSSAGSSGYFIYDNSGAQSGTVYWDANGGSSADAVEVARLQAGTSLNSSDFTIV